MIDLIESFEKHEKAIADYWKARVNGYYDSECYKALDAKMRVMQDCSDLVSQASKVNDWISNVSFPIVKERQLLRRAIVSANYRAPEIYACSPTGGTPFENAAKAELVLNLNMQNVKFRAKTLKPVIDTASKFGTAVTFTYWRKSGGEELRTTYNPTTGQYERKQVATEYENAYTCQIAPRDYFQNPDIPDPEDSDFQGHIRRVHLSELVPLMNDPAYIQENLKEALEEARKGRSATIVRNRDDEEHTKSDEKRYYVDIVRIEGQVNIVGNEEDETNYVCEMIGDKIIRLSREDYDRNMRSYTVLTFDKRQNYWWGTSDSEYIVSHENYLNTILGMTLDNALQSLNQYVFFDKKRIDPSAINNIVRNRGFVPVDANDIPVSQLISTFSPGHVDMSGVQYGVNAVQQSIQQMSTKIDLSRQTNQGGLNNKTATAANIIAGQSDILEADLIENFDFGVKEIGFKTLVLLQQILPDLFYVRPKPQEVEQELLKYMILGDYTIDIHSTVEKNKQGELLRLQNLVTWWLNVSQNPMMQQFGINIAPVIKEIWNRADVPSDEIMPTENMQMQAPGMVPSNQMMAMQGGGMVPQGQPQAMPQGQPMMGGM